MGDRNKGFVRIFQKWRWPLNIANAMDEPIDLYLQDASNLHKAIKTGPRGAAAQDVIDKGTIDACHLGDMRGAQAELA